jgi:hypothetical protein
VSVGFKMFRVLSSMIYLVILLHLDISSCHRSLVVFTSQSFVNLSHKAS